MGTQPENSEESSTYGFTILLLAPLATIPLHLFLPDVFVLKILANMTVLFMATAVLNVIEGSASGAQEFPVHFGWMTLNTLVGTVLCFWFGWTSTFILLGVFGAWSISGGLWQRRERSRS